MFSRRSCTTSRRPVGDERWDGLLAALAEHLAAQHDLAPPQTRTGPAGLGSTKVSLPFRVQSTTRRETL
jgi:hypothetical protein